MTIDKKVVDDKFIPCTGLAKTEQQQYDNLNADQKPIYQTEVDKYRQGNSYNHLNHPGIRETLAHRFGIWNVERHDRMMKNSRYAYDYERRYE